MKKLILPILLLIATFFSGCINQIPDYSIIQEIHKYGCVNCNTNINDACTFWINGNYYIIDSCSKYSIGDTIKYKKK